MKDSRFEIRFSGSGGQGIITAAILFAEAATLDKNFFVCQTQSYGPEARGGKSKAEVIVSTTDIDYPKVVELDMLLAMNQEACDSYFYDFKTNGLLIVDSTFVEQTPTSRVVAIPFTQIARDTFGQEQPANVIALGAIGYLCKIVAVDNLAKVLTARMPSAKNVNLKALRCGVKAAKKINLQHLPRSIFPEEIEV